MSGEQVNGLVAAGKVAQKRRVDVYVSLHGLPQGSGDGPEYDVLASTQPCDGDTDGADFLVWSTNIIMANTEGDFAVAKDVPLEGRFRSVKSISIFDPADPDQPKEEACGSATRR